MTDSYPSVAGERVSGHRRSPPIAYAVGLLRSRQVQSLADQAVVSGTNFVALLMLGRWTEPAEVGTYAIAVSLLMIAVAASDSLVTRPYAIRQRRPVGTLAQDSYGSLVLIASLAAGCSLSLLLVAAAFGATETAGLAVAALALAVVMPFALLREFARRVAYARLSTEHALAVDGTVAVLTIAGLAILAAMDLLTATTALLVMAAANALAAAGWLLVARTWFNRVGARTRQVLQQSWRLGRWLFVGQIAMQVQGYASYWLSMIVLGSVATGVYAATMSIVALANPLLFGFFNLLTPKSVNALHEGGPRFLHRQAVRDALILAGIMSCFCLLLALFGGEVLRLFYPRADYQAGEPLLLVLGLSVLAASVGVPASTGLAAGERVRAIAAVTTGTAILGMGMTLVALWIWGLMGAAYALLAVEIIGSVGRWIAFLAPTPTKRFIESQSTGTPRTVSK